MITLNKTNAWLSALWQRSKKMPSFHEATGIQEPAKEPKSDEHMLEIIKRMHATFSE